MLDFASTSISAIRSVKLQNIVATVFSSLEEYEKKISGLGSDLDGQKKAYDEQIKGETFHVHLIPISPLENQLIFKEMGERLSEVGKDISELRTLSGSGVEAVRGELDERLSRAEKRVVDVEEAFAGLKQRLEEVNLFQHFHRQTFM